MGGRRTTVNKTVIVPPPPPPPQPPQPPATVVINVTRPRQVVRVVQLPPPPPRPPQPQQVITSGNVAKIPSSISIGSTRISTPAPDFSIPLPRFNTPITPWNSVPFVPSFPAVRVTERPAISQDIEANIEISAAQSARDTVCADILDDPSSGEKSFVFTGNGSVTRFRFSARGAPSNVVVVNVNTGEIVSSSLYNVLVRGDSFSWLVFDTAPAAGVVHRVSFTVGDSGIVTVRAQNWSGWQSLISDVERRLANVKNAVNGKNSNARYVDGNSAFQWSISDPTLIGDAESAVRDLRSAIKRPGQQMNTTQIATICDHLERQFQRIESQLSKQEVIGGIRNASGNSPTFQNTDVGISSRIYQNDIRFGYFVGPSNAAIYNPPNAVALSPQRWRQGFDSATGRFFYSTN